MFLTTRSVPCPSHFALLATLFVALTNACAAQEKAARVTCAAAPGALLAKTGSGWKAIRQGDSVPAETPLVALFDATLHGESGVDVRILADLGQRGPFPTLESAITLHADAEHDLSLTPLQGLIVLTNVKPKGAAKVLLTFRGDQLEVTLKEPMAKLALEVFGRHAPGTPHLDDPKKDEPVMHVFFIALSGEAVLRHGEKAVSLHAPPGPAVLMWDSEVRQPEVQRLEELPPEVTALKEKDKKRLDEANAWAKELGGPEDAKQVLFKQAASENARTRQEALTAMAALDFLPAVLDNLAASPRADMRDHAVLVLRHWLGRAPGQTAKLAAALREEGYSPTQAHSVLHLLYGFTPEEQRDPSTYELLIEELKHKKAAVRVLAHWHLVRLAPAGKSIAFDARAGEAELQRSYEEWRKLIPPGKLPPRTAAPPK
jgi:hypothetical protein